MRRRGMRVSNKGAGRVVGGAGRGSRKTGNLVYRGVMGDQGLCGGLR